jgi:hypothetical protein
MSSSSGLVIALVCGAMAMARKVALRGRAVGQAE